MKTIKCTVLGDGGVGKTSLIVTYTTDVFPDEYIPTCFIDFGKIVLIEKTPVDLKLCDFAKYTDYDRINRLIDQNTDVFVLCFSLVSHTSLDNIVTKWKPEVAYKFPNVPCLLVGTKLDLKYDIYTINKLTTKATHVITTEEGLDAAKRIGAYRYIECSALSQVNLENVFNEAIKIVLAQKSNN
ncbi:Rho GTPase, putative [Entamoeba invadens IP1]|uniref:small monomeric GTPase n=1 Tax=Entamoeba invadens IP1 TaxID=370355 RepID=A0A0A1UBF0_ENTIV|nr:Rho GTPase, putative [Entamoeba invadens IP1]ELP92513.1 Rho GTPase, putative [Entamoeba invadens IP1]|eukprot:XP_004259284.1 Rho GTPase, putative [Entamoeba invadens IP1]